MRKVLFLLLFLPPFALGIQAQSMGGAWLGAEAAYDITAKWGAELGLGARLEDDFGRLTRYDAGFGIDYKPVRWLKIGVGYDLARDYSFGEPATIVYKKDPNSPDGIKYNSSGYPVVNGFNAEDAYWRTKHRFTFDLTEKWKIGRVGFSLRERYLLSSNQAVEGCEYKYREELEAGDLADYSQPYYGPHVDEEGDSYWYGLDRIEGKDAKTKHALRTRLGIEYNIRRCPVTPFVSYEISNDLSDGFAFERHRVMAGVDWTFTRDKRHSLSVAYLYQHGAQEESGDADLHILSVGYKLNLESAIAKRQKKAAKKARKAAVAK